MYFVSYRIRSFAALALTSLALLGVASNADAAGEKDKDALKLHDQAMDEDYLAVEFGKAEKKLKDALKRCGADGCTPKVLAKLHIAMGTVHGANNKLDLAKESFIAALKADPTAQLNESLTTPELAKAFTDAQKVVGPAKAAPPDAGTKAPDTKAPDKKPGPAAGGGEEPAGPKKPAGDLTHTPPPEQAVNTPVPIYIEVPEEVGATKVTLRYKPFGGTKWKTLEMQRVGDGYGVEIPCEDVTTTGDVKYFIIAKDEAGDPAGTAGSMKEPYRVPIKNEIEGDAPSLPGKKPPEECAAKEDCPPGLPGCPDAKGGGGGKRGEKGWGATCEQTEECQSGLICLNGTCEEDKGDGGDTEKPSGKKIKNIVGLYGQLDLLLISGGDRVCTGNDPSFACFYSSDPSKQFYGLPSSKKGTNGIQGGFGFAGARVMLAYDRQILDNLGLTVGARVGFAFGGPSEPSNEVFPYDTDAVGTQTQHVKASGFLPIHAEARATYVFGQGALEKGKFRPFVFIGGGLAQVNASVPVTVCDRVNEEGDAIAEGEGDSKCDGTAKERKLNAYQITGLNFVGLGGGAIYGITPNFGVAAELKVMFMVPTFGLVFAPTIGPVFGF